MKEQLTVRSSTVTDVEVEIDFPCYRKKGMMGIPVNDGLVMQYFKFLSPTEYIEITVDLDSSRLFTPGHASKGFRYRRELRGVPMLGSYEQFIRGEGDCYCSQETFQIVLAACLNALSDLVIQETQSHNQSLLSDSHREGPQ